MGNLFSSQSCSQTFLKIKKIFHLVIPNYVLTPLSSCDTEWPGNEQEDKIRCPTVTASKQGNKQKSLLELRPASQLAMTERISEKHCGGAGQKRRVE